MTDVSNFEQPTQAAGMGPTTETTAPASSGGNNTVVVQTIAGSAFSDRSPLATLTIYQGESIRVYGQLNVLVGTLTITEAPTWNVVDSLGFGGIRTPDPLTLYTQGAAVQVLAETDPIDTSSLPPGLYSVLIWIKARTDTQQDVRGLCKLVLNVKRAA